MRRGKRKDFSGKSGANVCLFFYVNGEFLVHGCVLDKAEKYGDFLIYPDSHFDIWDQNYAKKYGVDYDFFPRGRIAYRKSNKTYQILYDACIGDDIWLLLEAYSREKTELGYDEHYQCHKCNKNYVC